MNGQAGRRDRAAGDERAAGPMSEAKTMTRRRTVGKTTAGPISRRPRLIATGTLAVAFAALAIVSVGAGAQETPAAAGERTGEASAAGAGLDPEVRIGPDRNSDAEADRAAPTDAAGETEDSVDDFEPAVGGAALEAGVSRRVESGSVMDELDLSATQITGNQELPKVLYIVPWKQSDLGDLVGRPVNSLLDEVLQPIDREVFARQVNYYEDVYGQPEDGPGYGPGYDEGAADGGR